MNKIFKVVLVILLLLMSGCKNTNEVKIIRYDSNDNYGISYVLYIRYDDNGITNIEVRQNYNEKFLSDILNKKGKKDFNDLFNYFQRESREVVEQSKKTIITLRAEGTEFKEYPSISTETLFNEPNEDEFSVMYHFNLKSDDFNKNNILLVKVINNLGLEILFQQDVQLKDLINDNRFIYHYIFEDQNSIINNYSSEEFEKMLGNDNK